MQLESADLSNFDACVTGEGLLFLLDTEVLPGEDVLYVTCHSGGYTEDNATEVSADTVGKIRVNLGRTDPIEEAVAGYKPAISLDDNRDDMSAYTEYLDIASIRAGIAGEYVVTETAFFGNPEIVPFGVHTLHVRDTETEENWWIQWVSFGRVNYYYWKGGSDPEQRIAYATRFDCLLDSGRYYFIIPREVFFEETAERFTGNRNLSLRYITGGVDRDGKQVIEADTTDFLKLRFD